MKKIFIIITLFLFFFGKASFTLDGNGFTINQTGTDTSLAGLSSISGVTVTTYGTINPIKIYQINNRRLKFMGNCSWDATREKIIYTWDNTFSQTMSFLFEVNNGGNVNISSSFTFNGYTTYRPQEAIVFALGKNSIWNNREFFVFNNGKLTMKNILIKGIISPWIQPSNGGVVNLDNVIFDRNGTQSNDDIQINIHGNTKITDSKVYADGQSGFTFRQYSSSDTPPVIQNTQIYQARDAWNNESFELLNIKNSLTSNLGNTVDVSQWNKSLVTDGNYNNGGTRVINSQLGTQFKWGGHLLNDGANRSVIEIFQEFNAKVLDNSLSPVANAKVLIVDNPVAADPTHLIQYDNKNANIVRKYTLATNAAGETSTEMILIGEGKRTVGGNQFSGNPSDRIRPRGINTTASSDSTDDLYPSVALHYNYLISQQNITLKGLSAVTGNFILTTDDNITKSEAQASAISGININHTSKTIKVSGNITLCDLYDYAKYDKVTTSLEMPTTGTMAITTVGKTLDIGSYQLILTSNGVITPCNKFEKIKSSSTTAGIINNYQNLQVAYEDPYKVYKLIRLINVINGTINIIDENTNTTLYQQINYTGDVNLTVSSNSNNVSILVTRQGYTNWATNVDLSMADVYSYTVVQTIGDGNPAILQNQEEEIMLLKIIVQKLEAIDKSININNSNSVLQEISSLESFVTNLKIETQQATKDLLKIILNKITSIRKRVKIS